MEGVEAHTDVAMAETAVDTPVKPRRSRARDDRGRDEPRSAESNGAASILDGTANLF